MPRWIDLVLISLLGFIAPLASLRLNLVRDARCSRSGQPPLFLVGTQLAFNHGWVVLVRLPAGRARRARPVGALAVHYLLAAFERERVRDMFSRFVPEAVVDQVLARTDGDLRLGGVPLDGTVMFTDLRGFTTFSEALAARRR